MNKNEQGMGMGTKVVMGILIGIILIPIILVIMSVVLYVGNNTMDVTQVGELKLEICQDEDEWLDFGLASKVKKVYYVDKIFLMIVINTQEDSVCQ